MLITVTHKRFSHLFLKRERTNFVRSSCKYLLYKRVWNFYQKAFFSLSSPQSDGRKKTGLFVTVIVSKYSANVSRAWTIPQHLHFGTSFTAIQSKSVGRKCSGWQKLTRSLHSGSLLARMTSALHMATANCNRRLNCGRRSEL